MGPRHKDGEQEENKTMPLLFAEKGVLFHGGNASLASMPQQLGEWRCECVLSAGGREEGECC